MKSKTNHTIAVIGDGGWGTTLAIGLARSNHKVTLWGPFPEYVAQMRKNRHNSKFLPGIKFPISLTLEENLSNAVENNNIIVFAVPSKFTPKVIKQMKKFNFDNKIFLSVTKGFDNTNLLRISEIILKELGNINFAVLSGPTIASEVAQGIPSTAVIASPNTKTAKTLQSIFNSETFRIYTNKDVIGVELGGTLKNVIALACGICDGLGFGSNTKAAILTRGLAEMSRLGKAMGAKPQTFSGLSGLGDLVTTCTSPRSRNRTVGEQIGKGHNIKEILSSMEMVAEGVETAVGAYKLSQKYKVSMPITEEIYKVLYKNKKASKAVSDLMGRQTTAE